MKGDMSKPFPWSEIDYRNVGCALCHVKDDKPMMYSLPPMDFPGMRDARAEFRLHDQCYALITNIVGAALFTGFYGAGVH
jgi:hypothetical protein